MKIGNLEKLIGSIPIDIRKRLSGTRRVAVREWTGRRVGRPLTCSCRFMGCFIDGCRAAGVRR